MQGAVQFFTSSQDRPGSQFNRQPKTASTREAFTLVALRAEVLKSLSSEGSLTEEFLTDLGQKE